MKGRILVVAFGWLLFVFLCAAVWRLWLQPNREAAQAEADKQAHEQAIQSTGSTSRYRTQINFAYDSFSGYSILRSDTFGNNVGNKKLKVNFIDDGANYTERLRGLQTGKYQMASFTIDALIKASSELGDLPATVVAFIDETRGADAMVGYKLAVSNIDVLNDPQVKFVLTPNSPSETLARVVMSHFGLNNVSSKSFVEAKDAEDVYRRYRQSKPTDKLAFLVWEPYVTKMLENPNMQVLVDSSRFRGYIVDVIVASRDFLVKDEVAVRDFVESYLRSVYAYRETSAMQTLISHDAQKAGQPLNQSQIERLVKGIWWKNTIENYAHMGLSQDKPLQHVEDMIVNITNVLVSTGAIPADPTQGRPNFLYYDKILAGLRDANFYPGGSETLRQDSDTLPVLSDEDWSKLTPVGTLQVPTIVFARGTSRISEQSEITLNELIEKLKSWPQYYVMVKGNASLRGDIEANKRLAEERAKAVEKYLLEHSISETRVKAVAVEPSGSTDVVFQLGYMPY